MCRQHSLCPDVWSLYDWCNWLTPEHMGPKRFDTIFYMCILNDMPSVLIDEQEITEVRVTALMSPFSIILVPIPSIIFGGSFEFVHRFSVNSYTFRFLQWFKVTVQYYSNNRLAIKRVKEQ